MRIARSDIPVRVQAPGATARQLPDFGTPEGPVGVEYFTLAAGTDMAPLLRGLEDDLCQADHWGYVAAGRVVVEYADSSVETCSAGDVFYWPSGHSVRVEEDAELIMFSPQAEHGAVLDHIAQVIAAMA